jgi:hypothetical protein
MVPFAQLADVTPEASEDGVAADLGYESVDAAIVGLAEHAGIVVLDNCEHMTGVVRRFIEHLREDVTNAVVVATSRAPVGVEGEHLFPVMPLGLPSRGGHDADRTPAVELYSRSWRGTWRTPFGPGHGAHTGPSSTSRGESTTGTERRAPIWAGFVPDHHLAGIVATSGTIPAQNDRHDPPNSHASRCELASRRRAGPIHRGGSNVVVEPTPSTHRIRRHGHGRGGVRIEHGRSIVTRTR